MRKVKGLLPKVREVGEFFKRGLEELGAGEVRGRGLMLGLDIKRDCKDIVLKALERGLIINCTAGTVLRFLPPLIVEKEHVEECLDILREVLR